MSTLQYLLYVFVSYLHDRSGFTYTNTGSAYGLALKCIWFCFGGQFRLIFFRFLHLRLFDLVFRKENHTWVFNYDHGNLETFWAVLYTHVLLLKSRQWLPFVLIACTKSVNVLSITVSLLTISSSSFVLSFVTSFLKFSACLFLERTNSEAKLGLYPELALAHVMFYFVMHKSSLLRSDNHLVAAGRVEFKTSLFDCVSIFFLRALLWSLVTPPSPPGFSKNIGVWSVCAFGGLIVTNVHFIPAEICLGLKRKLS